MLRLESETLPRVGEIKPRNLESARNLAHYMALRRYDLRSLQEKLASVGLSSLGRSEAHVLATVDEVLGILSDLVGVPQPPAGGTPPLSYQAGRTLLKRNADELLGPSPRNRTVRIMVTMPTEAAYDYQLVESLLGAGMDLMRINCAHDDPATWSLMIENLKRARERTGRQCRLLMDIPGPKVRTGPLEPGPKVKKVRPTRSRTGAVVSPAVVLLSSGGKASANHQAVVIPLEPGSSIDSVKPGDTLSFRDARDARRRLHVTSVGDDGVTAELRKTAYFETGTPIALERGEEEEVEVGRVGEIPPITVPILLRVGDRLFLSRFHEEGHPARYRDDGSAESPALITCTAPQAIASLKIRERVWFDDGRIGGVVTAVDQEGAMVEVTSAPPDGAPLGPDKGVNMPETDLHLPPVSAEDEMCLEFIAKNADLLGQSFVRTPRDVLAVQAKLKELGGENVGVVLKIETKAAFENLPSLLFAGMKSRSSGVMIARGDLAVEVGWERMAEIQEEILWFCEAAHLPVVWATQVLESMTKTGQPSRAEITDAAFSEGAECVMLNKGPHVVEAVRALDDILRRMASHREKKSAMLRRLRVADNFLIS